ncbi:hypothetical protein ACTVQD_22560 (plasmid) [Serratia marcescens]|uniref:hypothetical protein n=1 Tax=Serratia marcescens TaxID=615 RepID=UPI003FA69965
MDINKKIPAITNSSTANTPSGFFPKYHLLVFWLNFLKNNFDFNGQTPFPPVLESSPPQLQFEPVIIHSRTNMPFWLILAFYAVEHHQVK